MDGLKTIRIRPTLLVGLGGTGGDVLLRVRRRFYEKFGRLEEFPIVGYLWIDTDRSEKHILAEEIKSFAHFADSERLIVTIQDTAAITQHLDRPENRGIKDWWYPGLSKIGTMTEGAGQIRAYSRLAFFKHYPEIRAALENAHRRVRDAHNQEVMQKSRVLNQMGVLADVDFGAPTNVILVSSVAGGTGSGMVLDAGFLIKDVLGDRASTTAHLVFPGHFGAVTNERMKANGYALLKELNYYQYGTHLFEATWDPSETRRLPIPPFSFTYVYDHVNSEGLETGGRARSQETIFETLAESIFKDFTHGSFADEKRSARVNFAQFLNENFRRSYQRFTQQFPQRYLSLGFSSVQVPHHRIITSCAYRLAAEVVERWGGFGSDAPNQAALPAFVKDQALPRLDLVEDESAGRHDLLFAIQDPDGAGDASRGKSRGHMKALTDFSDKLRLDVERGLYARESKGLRAWLEARLDEERKRLKFDEGEPQRWGHYPRAMRGSSDAMVKQYRERLRDWSFRLIDDEGFSLAYVRDALAELGRALVKQAEDFERRATEQQEAIGKRQKELDARLKEVSRWERRSFPDGRTGTIFEYLTNQVREAAVGDLRKPGVLRSELRQRMLTEGARTARNLAREISGQERADGSVGGGLVDQFGRLEANLRNLAATMRERSAYFSRVEDNPQSEILYTADEIEKTYYPAYVRGPEDLRQVSREALELLGRRISGLSEDYDQGTGGRWEEALLTVGRRRFARIASDFHVLKVLRRKHPGEGWKVRLRDLYLRSGHWVTGSAIPGSFKLPDQQVARKIGLPGPTSEMTPAEAQETKDFGVEVRRFLEREVAPQASYSEVPESAEILFYQEAGGFPVNYSARLSEMRTSYMKLYAAGEELHIDRRDERFGDLAILTEEEQQALLDARRAFLLGCSFDVLKFPSKEYIYERRTGAMRIPTPLGTRPKAMAVLTSDAGLRASVLEEVEAWRRRVLQSPDAENTARWYAFLTLLVKDAYGGQAVRSEDELDFEPMLEVKVLQTELERVEPAARAAGLDWNALLARAEALVDAPDSVFPRRAGDGMRQMVLQGAPA